MMDAEHQTPLSRPVSEYPNLIFDLGGVILDLSVANTVQSFADGCGKPIEELWPLLTSSTFVHFELGLITEDEFRWFVRETVNRDWSDRQIDECWNAMLGGITRDRLEVLKKLRSSKKTFLLSNTNSIHLRRICSYMSDTHGYHNLSPFFHSTYFSHEMKLRKPDPAIFSLVLTTHELKPDDTLFLDDNVANLAGAASLGIHTLHVTNPNELIPLFA